MGLLAAVPDPARFQPISTEKKRDPLWRNKLLNECWSMNASREFHGEIPMQSHATKELVIREAILWFERDRNPDWERLEA